MSDTGGKTCTRCGKTKPLVCFSRRSDYDGPYCWCKICQRIHTRLYRETEAGRAYLAAYAARPEVKARKAMWQRLRYARPEVRQQRTAAHREWRRSPRGKVYYARSYARARLARTTDPDRRRTLLRLIAGYDRELARLQKARA